MQALRFPHGDPRGLKDDERSVALRLQPLKPRKGGNYPMGLELRIHGRGGQGAVVASKLLASALFHEGKFVQSFPAFWGAKSTRSPVTAFLRLSDSPIRLRCEIARPDGLDRSRSRRSSRRST